MLRQKLQDEMTAALKSKDSLKLNTLRFAIARVKNQEIEKKRDLNDEETISILKKIVQELKESIAVFEKAGRPELVQENKDQLGILNVYLPQEISDEELEREIKKVIEQNRELFNKNRKAIIGIAIKALKNKADTQRIIKILNEIQS